MADRTKEALVEALNRLLLTRSIDKITISDIADECGVNRMTFYYHFRDIYDCLAWAAEREAWKALSDCRDYDTWDRGFLSILEHAWAKKPYVMSLYRSLSRGELERFLYAYVSGLVQPVILREASGMDISEKDLLFIANFYKYPFVGIFLTWISEGMEEEPEELVGQLRMMLRDSIHGSLERFEKERGADKRLRRDGLR